MLPDPSREKSTAAKRPAGGAASTYGQSDPGTTKAYEAALRWRAHEKCLEAHFQSLRKPETADPATTPKHLEPRAR
jgi:hypothetical protein